MGNSLMTTSSLPPDPELAFDSESDFERALGGSVPARIEDLARRFPDHVAIKTPLSKITFSELNASANRIARAVLAACTATPGTAAVLMEKGPGMSAAQIGIAKTAMPYVVLNRSHPLSRTRHILDDSESRLIVTNSANLPLARELAEDFIAVLNCDEIDANSSSENLARAISPDAILSIAYTSGSTGKPKGVIQTHSCTLHRLAAGMKTGLSSHDRMASVGSGGTDNYRALLSGATVYPWNVKEAGFARLAAWMREERITIFNGVPSVFRDFAATLSPGDRLPDLRMISLRGETLYRKDVELFRRHFPPPCVLVNELGSTETRTMAQFVVDDSAKIKGHIVPVGYPIRDKDILILDENGLASKPGDIGEIAIQSRYISPGYWRRPGLTSEKFTIPTGGSSLRIYRTGDLGRLNADGCLEHLGRKDSQVKIRGQRIELGEIEAALRHLQNIKDAAVVAREDTPGDRRLVAYLTADHAPHPDISILQLGLASILPDYMLPSTFVFLDAMPMTASGKISRLDLPPPMRNRPSLPTPYVPPRTPVEQALAEIWMEILNLETIGIQDRFPELGGSSLQAVRIVSRIYKLFEVEVPPRYLFDQPTIESAAVLILRELAAQAGDEVVEAILGETEQNQSG